MNSDGHAHDNSRRRMRPRKPVVIVTPLAIVMKLARSMQMLIPVMTLALVAQLTVTIADNVPHFDLKPVCHGIAQQGGLDLEPGQGVRQDFVRCIKSETAIRDRLVKQWPTFKASDKTNCIAESSAGGIASYTDLLTCLQMANDAGRLNQ
jgi:hypothetical protein